MYKNWKNSERTLFEMFFFFFTADNIFAGFGKWRFYCSQHTLNNVFTNSNAHIMYSVIKIIAWCLFKVSIH